MTKSSGNKVNFLGSQQWFELKCVLLQLVEKKLYLKLISRNKRSIDWLSKLIGRNKRSHDWLREIVIVTYYWLQLERGLLILQKNWKSWYDSQKQKSRKHSVILGWPQASLGLPLWQRVFVFFHQNLGEDYTKIQDIQEGLSFSPEFGRRLYQNSGHTGGSFFFTRIWSPTVPKFRTYRRVFLFHQNLGEDRTLRCQINE